MSQEEDLEEQRENLREAIRGAFYSLAEEDKGLQTHMVAAYVEYYLVADHEPLSPQEQVGILGLVHTTILKMLRANPVSLQMAHAHAYVHALADTYTPDEDDDEESDMLLEENADDLDAWAAELNEYLEKKEDDEGGEGPAGPTEDDSGPDEGSTAPTS